jgi:hypothetical protein
MSEMEEEGRGDLADFGDQVGDPGTDFLIGDPSGEASKGVSMMKGVVPAGREEEGRGDRDLSNWGDPERVMALGILLGEPSGGETEGSRINGVVELREGTRSPALEVPKSLLGVPWPSLGLPPTAESPLLAPPSPPTVVLPRTSPASVDAPSLEPPPWTFPWASSPPSLTRCRGVETASSLCLM